MAVHRAQIFMSGDSLAVRLPKDIAFPPDTETEARDEDALAERFGL